MNPRKTNDLPHVRKAKKLMEKKGLEGEDWTAAKYFEPENKPDSAVAYDGGQYFFVLCYKKGTWMFEDKLAFTSKAVVEKFVSLVEARLTWT